VSRFGRGATATTSRGRLLLTLGIAALVIVLDQVSKTWAVRSLADGHTIDLVGSLRFNLAFNTGASFSIGSGLGPVFAIVVVFVVVVLLRYASHATSRLALVGIGLVVGGAVGNLLDRILRAGDGFLQGGVVDFIDAQWWPIFNIADIGVVVGAVLLVIGTWLTPDAVDSPVDGNRRADDATRDDEVDR
jgi:signal peptidase II